MPLRKVLTGAAILLLGASAAGAAASWQSLAFPGRGVPDYLFVENGISIVVDEGFLTTPVCCSAVVNIQRGDHDGSSVSTLETLGPSALPFGAARFAGGVAALVKVDGDYIIKHYSFGGVITTITPGAPASTAGPLASDGQTLYAIWDGNILSLDSLGGNWVTGPAVPLLLPAGRREHGVVVGTQVYWQTNSALIRFTPPGTFDHFDFPTGYRINDLSAWTEAGGTIYVALRSPANTAAMLEISPTGTMTVYDSVLPFQDYSGARVLGTDVFVGGFDRASDHFGSLLAFDTVGNTWREFSPQGPWNQVFGQITDIAADQGNLYVAWERTSFETVSRLHLDLPPPPPPDCPTLSQTGGILLISLLAGLGLLRLRRGAQWTPQAEERKNRNGPVSASPMPLRPCQPLPTTSTIPRRRAL